jgi:hypothetical protein
MIGMTLGMWSIAKANIIQIENNHSNEISLSQAMPKEISAMLTSAEFSQTIAILKKKAMEDGKSIRIEGYDVLVIGANTYAYLFLTVKQNTDAEAEGAWKAFGSLTSRIEYTKEQNPTLDGLWFSPISEPPGGATVGN